MKKLIALLLLNLAVALMCFAGCFVVIGWIIVLCGTVCAVPAMMLEDLCPSEAYNRSWELTKENRFRIFALFCLNLLVALVAQVVAVVSLVTIAKMGNQNPFYLLEFTTLILMSFFYALMPTISTHLFFDLRIRNEPTPG